MVIADLALRPEAQELVSQYREIRENKGRAVFQETNVRKWKQLERMFEVAINEFGGADIVCPGAGVFEPVCVHWQLAYSVVQAHLAKHQAL